MKWRKPIPPKQHDTRVVRKFAWLPTTIGETDGEYVVWLETYESHQIYRRFDTQFSWIETQRRALWYTL
jgi:hypothetical protein